MSDEERRLGGWTRDELRRAGAELAARSRSEQGLSAKFDDATHSKLRRIFTAPAPDNREVDAG